MGPRLPHGALLLALLSIPLRADDVESLHSFDFTFALRMNWTLQVHTRARTFENLGGFNEFRAGPTVMWHRIPRLTLIGSYYFMEQNTRVVHDFYQIHRPWGGAQYVLFKGRGWSVDGRGLLDRYISNHFDDYWRTRARLRLSRNTRIGQAYVTAEVLRGNSTSYGRWTTGLQWKVDERVTLGLGYEYRDAAKGPGSHVIASSFDWGVR